MAFYRKIPFTISILALIPVFAFAQSRDFFSVTGTLSNGQISIESVEQRVFDVKDLTMYKSGTYEARVIKGNRLVSNNFFEIVENFELWVEVEGTAEQRYRSDKAVFNVKLPLTESLDAADAFVEIWKGSILLYSRRISELPLTVLTAKEDTVRLIPAPEGQEPPTQEKGRSFWPWLFGGFAIFAAWFIWRWRTVRKKYQESDYMMK